MKHFHDLKFRAKLLASSALIILDAAIEAARRGEHSRAFAVVADKVRKLTERRTMWKKRIAGTIKTSQAVTAGAASSVGEETSEVEHGIDFADRADASLGRIVGMIKNLVDMGTQIAVVSGQQSSANEQIAENVEAIINATNQRQADLQQIARAAEDLNKLTENLRQYMGRVKSSPEQRSHQVSSMHNRTTLSKTLKSSIAVGANGTLIEHEDEPTSEERRTS